MRRNSWFVMLLAVCLLLVFGGPASAGPLGLFGCGGLFSGGRCHQTSGCGQSVQYAQPQYVQPTSSVVRLQPQYTPVRTAAGEVIYGVGSAFQSLGTCVGGSCATGTCSNGSCSGGVAYYRWR